MGPGCPHSLPLALFLAASVCACGDGGSDGGGGDGDGELRLETRDGKSLSARLIVSDASPPGSPGVLLIHQFRQSDEQWGSFPDALSSAGYRVLVFDLRGHGESDPYDGELTDLLSDREAATADRDAALAYLVGDGEADPAHIGVIGTSIGANLAVAAAIDELATTYVSLSANRQPAENFAGAVVTGVRSVFYLAASEDTAAATSAQQMHDVSNEPRAIHIYDGSAAHGVMILEQHADAADRVLGWLEQEL